MGDAKKLLEQRKVSGSLLFFWLEYIVLNRVSLLGPCLIPNLIMPSLILLYLLMR